MSGKWRRQANTEQTNTKDEDVNSNFFECLFVERTLKSILRAVSVCFRIAFQHPARLAPFIYLALAIPLTLLLSYKHIDDRALASLRYLLSAQAQVVGGILGITFTATFVVAQLASRYSQRVPSHILGPWTLWYLVPYLIGIVLPLFLLSSNFSLWATRVSLWLGGLCLALLIPYFVALRDRLSLDTVIREMEAKWTVSDLQNFAMGALQNYDYATYERALEAVQNVGQSIIEAKLKNSAEGKIIDSLRNGLVNIARSKLDDPRAPFVAINVLREVGCKAACGLENDTRSFLDALYKIATEGVRRDLPDAAEYAVGAFGIVGAAAVQNKVWEALRDEQGAWILAWMGDISKTALEKSMDEVANKAVVALRNMASTTLKLAADCQVKKVISLTARRASETIGEITVAAIETISEDLANCCVGQLQGIGGEAIQKGVVDVVRQICHVLRKIFWGAFEKKQTSVLRGVAWAAGKLRREVYNNTKGGGIMEGLDQDVLGLYLDFLCSMAEKALEYGVPINDVHWGFISSLFQGLGYAVQDALDSGDENEANCSYETLKKLANWIVKNMPKERMTQAQQECLRYLVLQMSNIAQRTTSGHWVRDILDLLQEVKEAAERDRAMIVLGVIAEQIGIMRRQARTPRPPTSTEPR